MASNYPEVDYMGAAAQQGQTIGGITQGVTNLATGIDKLAEISKLQNNKRIWIGKGNQALTAMFKPDEFPEFYASGTAWWNEKFDPNDPNVDVASYNKVIGNLMQDALHKREAKKIHPDQTVTPVYPDAYLVGGQDADNVTKMRDGTFKALEEQSSIKGLQDVATKTPQTGEEAKRMAAGQFPITGGMDAFKKQQDIAGGFATSGRYIKDQSLEDAKEAYYRAKANAEKNKGKLTDNDRAELIRVLPALLTVRNKGINAQLEGYSTVDVGIAGDAVDWITKTVKIKPKEGEGGGGSAADPGGLFTKP